MNTGREKGEESNVIVVLQTDACDCLNREGCRAISRRQGEETNEKRDRERREETKGKSEDSREQ